MNLVHCSRSDCLVPVPRSFLAEMLERVFKKHKRKSINISPPDNIFCLIKDYARSLEYILSESTFLNIGLVPF